MKFHFEDMSKRITHWMLQNEEVAERVSNTPEFKRDGTLVAAVTVNGVNMPFEALESYFADSYVMMEEEYKIRYADVEEEVQRRLEAKMVAEAQPILDKLHALSSVLDDAKNLIKPYWDRS